ncbi:hypothetical protein [Thermoleophilum album]|uniref:Uncharacterized protein n=1 Tax=Thermoleophilum album TaxID=29539 RepID=A0A1H6FTZ2_THEAL|nr:hypothetical protein [Thermoleophilum album]SEH13740.1 hypothetical protein SAMN02745716_1292 [Thermoleophilum album]
MALNPASWTLTRAAELAGGIGAMLRRAQLEREPRVTIVASNGARRVLTEGERGYDRALEVAEAMIAVIAKGGDAGGGEQRPAGGAGAAEAERR